MIAEGRKLLLVFNGYGMVLNRDRNSARRRFESAEDFADKESAAREKKSRQSRVIEPRDANVLGAMEVIN